MGNSSEKNSNSEDAEALPTSRPRDPSDLQDLELIEAIKAGDNSAFAQLYQKYNARITNVLMGVLRNREDALEACQDVFVKVHKQLASFKPQARFYTWLYRIAVNQGIDVIRKKKRRPEHLVEGTSFELEEGHSPDGIQRASSPSWEAQRKELMTQIDSALSELKAKHRDVFLLHSIEGMSYQEISDVLEVPMGTVMSRLFYARRRMAELLPNSWDPAHD